MLRIFIVENDNVQRNQFETVISDFITIEDLSASIEISTCDPYKCLEYLQKRPNIKGLYFLDLHLDKDINGMELGRRIKILDPNGRIVIVTAEGAMALLTFAYKMEVLDYIIKDSIEEVHSRIRSCIRIAYSRYMEIDLMHKQALDIEIGRKIKSFPLEEVLYIETARKQGHRLTLYTLDSEMNFRGHISSIKARCPHLIESHRGILVNLDNVVSFDEKLNTLLLKNGATCPVSIRKLNQIKKELSKRAKY